MTYILPNWLSLSPSLRGEGRNTSPCVFASAPRAFYPYVFASAPRSSFTRACSLALHAHGDTHAAADAERREALLGIAPAHLVQQRCQHARAGSADRVTERNRAAVDVDLLGIPAEVLVHRAGLRGEGLIGLDQVEILDLPAGLLQRGARSRDRAGAHDG